MRQLIRLVALISLPLAVGCGERPAATPTAKPRATQIAQLTQVAAAIEASAVARPPLPTAEAKPTMAPAAATTPTPLPPLPAPPGWASYRGTRVTADVLYPEDWTILDEAAIKELGTDPLGWPIVSFAPAWGTPGRRGLTIRRYSSAIPGQTSTAGTASQLLAGMAHICEPDGPLDVSTPYQQTFAGLAFSRLDLSCNVGDLHLTLSSLVAQEKNELGVKATWMIATAGRGTLDDDDYVIYLTPMLEQLRIR